MTLFGLLLFRYHKRSTLRKRLYNYGQIDFECGTRTLKPGFELVSGNLNPGYQHVKGNANNQQPEPQKPKPTVLEAGKLKNDLKTENLMPGSEINLNTENEKSNVGVNDKEMLLPHTTGKAGQENAPAPPSIAPKPKLPMAKPVPYSPPPTPEGYVVAEHY